MAAETLRTKAFKDFDMDSSLWGRPGGDFPDYTPILDAARSCVAALSGRAFRDRHCSSQRRSFSSAQEPRHLRHRRGRRRDFVRRRDDPRPAAWASPCMDGETGILVAGGGDGISDGALYQLPRAAKKFSAG